MRPQPDMRRRMSDRHPPLPTSSAYMLVMLALSLGAFLVEYTADPGFREWVSHGLLLSFGIALGVVFGIVLDRYVLRPVVDYRRAAQRRRGQ